MIQKKFINQNLSKEVLSFGIIFSFCCLSLFFIACENETAVCPHCNDDDDDNQQSAMVAEISGAFNLKFDSESFEYHIFDYKEYQMREIIAKMYVDSAYLEIRITFNDYSNGNNLYNFSNNNGNATLTFYSMPAEYFQYNIQGSISLSNCNENEISATFNFSATTTDQDRVINVNKGVINFQKN